MKRLDTPVIIIFGITGDLSKRKLLPALAELFRRGILKQGTKIIGISRHQLSQDDVLQIINSSLANKAQDDHAVDLSSAVTALQLNPTNLSDFQRLKSLLESFDSLGACQRLYYMSIPPAAYAPIIENLSRAGLNTENDRLLLEKPFGYNLESAKSSIDLVSKAFRETQVYRIDHYLAKETAQNLLAFRLHNPIFVPLWNNQHIERVHIRQFESIGIEGRTNFYEQTGALRDMIQSHLMQLLALTMMTVPDSMTSSAIHKAKIDFLSSLAVADPKLSIRGQYDGYRQEVNQPNSNVETYVKLQLSSQSKIWQGVQFILEHGKAMHQSIADVNISFKTSHEKRRNSLTFQVQPDETIRLDLLIKEPGLTNNMRHADLKLSYSDVFPNSNKVDAYARVIMDAINGDQSLFASNQEVINNWQILEPLLEAWSDNSHGLIIYPYGATAVR